MYRVELKDEDLIVEVPEEKVPNVPCGVESSQCGHSQRGKAGVPNVPCGVERQSFQTVRVATNSSS